MLEKREDIDAVLEKYAENWTLERMSIIDRSILRVAGYELLFGGKTPAKTVLNEAIEMAKRFGDTDSGRFINGLLDRMVQYELHQK